MLKLPSFLDRYGKSFYSQRRARSLYAARTILAQLSQVYQHVQIRSVLDVGCGTGTWLEASKSIGSDVLFGIEGAWLPQAHFFSEATLLTKDLDLPFSLSKTFDLTISLEVAEHISPSSAVSFIHSLSKTSDLILFSAAPPGQGGKHHVNEQPISYWCELFSRFGFYPVDCIRDSIWNNPHIDFWYKQNTLVFQRLPQPTSPIPNSYIHPELFKLYSSPNSFLALKLFLHSLVPTTIKFFNKLTH